MTHLELVHGLVQQLVSTRVLVHQLSEGSGQAVVANLGAGQEGGALRLCALCT